MSAPAAEEPVIGFCEECEREVVITPCMQECCKDEEIDVWICAVCESDIIGRVTR